jgi:hypothetical protein
MTLTWEGGSWKLSARSFRNTFSPQRTLRNILKEEKQKTIYRRDRRERRGKIRIKETKTEKARPFSLEAFAIQKLFAFFNKFSAISVCSAVERI